MKHLKFIILASILIIFAACNKQNDVRLKADSSFCNFVQNDKALDGYIDKTERAIMQECRQNAFTSKSDIENNLIGEWKLIGHGEGRFPVISQPCAYFIISNDKLKIKYEHINIDTVTTHAWELKRRGDFFQLRFTPRHRMGFINRFSRHYMYGDATPEEGYMFLLQKVE